MSAKVLVIGSGGREHALAWKLAQSEKVQSVFVSPGNAGTHGKDKVSNVAIDVKDFDSVATWCEDNEISLVVVGPEDPLAAGIADSLTKRGIACFGPSAAAAEIEASKAYAKDFMDRHKIPTAKWKSFTDSEKAVEYIKKVDHAALVVKASGLAAGKGVIVAKDKEEACEAVKDILQDNKFGKAGSTVVVEELLEGEEISCLAFCDGSSVACFPPAQDHKRAYDGDEGPNTGGMGAYCPCPLPTSKELEIIEKEVIQRAVSGMKADGKPYVGVLYAGLMLTRDGPKVLEYNCRFGDPETQVILPMLSSDLYGVMQACVEGRLASLSLQFEDKQHAVAVVLVSEGYPGSYKKGFQVNDIEKAEKELGVTVFHAGTVLKDGKTVTSGGRVLATVAMASDLPTAASAAQKAAEIVQFDGKYFRKDIAHKAIKQGGLSYKASGVDIGAGDALVERIKPLAAATSRPGCQADLGMFGGIFDVKAAGYTDPLLVSGTDGVGTKLKIAQICNMHDSIGVDLVAMCVNDVLAHGAEPLFFLDYFACGKLEVGVAKSVVEGVAKGCQMAGCALLGGETAEMPGMYSTGEYDLAGFTVGAVERDQYLPQIKDIVVGDQIVGISSSGVHSNGYSLVRRIIEHCDLEYNEKCPFEENKTLGEVLLTPTKIYCKQLLPALRSGKVKALAHITGGGLIGNVPRVLPDGVGVHLNAAKWNMPPVFGWLAEKGNVACDEMARTFNCGVGVILVVGKEMAEDVIDMVQNEGETAHLIGSVVSHDQGNGRVEIENLAESLRKSWPGCGKHRAAEDLSSDSDKKVRMNGTEGTPTRKRKIGVLISGSGTNLQALIDYTKNPVNKSAAEIVLVISNKPGVKGLTRAKSAGIATQVVNHKDYKNREEFDAALDSTLREADVELVCLAGFMRILTGGFVRKWDGKMLNVHPSLLPSFKGANAHKLVLEANVRISGCSVHFVSEEVDAGAILVQESVPVYPDDTEETLSERVKSVEHRAFPRALELVASGKATLQSTGKIMWQM